MQCLNSKNVVHGFANIMFFVGKWKTRALFMETREMPSKLLILQGNLGPEFLRPSIFQVQQQLSSEQPPPGILSAAPEFSFLIHTGWKGQKLGQTHPLKFYKTRPKTRLSEKLELFVCMKWDFFLEFLICEHVRHLHCGTTTNIFV